MTKHTMIVAMHDFMLEIAEELQHNPGQDSVDTFERRKPQMLRQTLGVDLTKYTLTFPLNIRRIQDMPDTFSTPETTIMRIDRSTWKTECEADARDDDAFTRFLEESPNTLEPDRYGNETFTFWTVDYAARDGYYALSVIQEIIRLFVAKLNFVFHERQRGQSQPVSSDRTPYARWSPLQEPFFYLIFDSNDYVDYRPMDFDYRRRPLFPSEEMEDAMDRFDELPDLPVEDDDRDSLDVTLVNALFALQDGITASTPQQSFFSFWRGVENLTHVEPQQSTALIMERARPLFEAKTEEEYVPQHQKDAIAELYRKRNDLAHTGPPIRIQEPHRTVIKRILDKLLALHVDRYTEYDETDFKTFLVHYNKPLDGNKQALKRNKRENQIIRDVILEEFQREYDSLFLKDI